MTEARDRRERAVRAKSTSMKLLSPRKLEEGRAEYPESYDRPRMRSECVDGDRPCGFVSCRYHLFLDVSPRTGSIKLNFPDLDVDTMPNTCALDIADRGDHTLLEVGRVMNLTRERARQLEGMALAKVARVVDAFELGRSE